MTPPALTRLPAVGALATIAAIAAVAAVGALAAGPAVAQPAAPAAAVPASAPPASAAPAASAADSLPRYTIDPTHTAVFFEAVHRGVSISRGRWTRSAGEIAFDRAARRGRVDITVAVASLSTGIGAFDGWLLGPAVFDAARHPTARFEAVDFTFDGRRLVRASGRLTVRGLSRPLTLEATLFDCYTSPLFRREVCGGDFEATIDPRQWLPAEALQAAAVPDRVKLLVQVEGVRQ